MTCNFFSPSLMNPYAHVNTSCLPAFPSANTSFLPAFSSVNTSCLPAFPPAYTSCMPAYTHAHTSCMPTPAFQSFHNHYDAHGHHHGAGNTLVLNMCTPCCPQPKPEAKKPPIDLSKLAITTNPVTGEILEATTKNPTGQNIKQCIDVIQKAKNDLEISSSGKLAGGCDNNSSCKACMDAINKSVSDVRPTGGGDKSKEVPSGAPTHDGVEYDSHSFDAL